MSREIKFRQWCNRDKKFHYWGYLQDNNEYFESPLGYMSKDNPRKSQQFTGLKDKNGKEIYEGDIVNWSGWKIGFKHIDGTEVKLTSRIVEFAEGCFRLKDDVCWNLSIWENIEIIGNIYENQELLTNKS